MCFGLKDGPREKRQKSRTAPAAFVSNPQRRSSITASVGPPRPPYPRYTTKASVTLPGRAGPMARPSKRPRRIGVAVDLHDAGHRSVAAWRYGVPEGARHWHKARKGGAAMAGQHPDFRPTG